MTQTKRLRKIGDKFYDLGTPNTSFLRTAKILQTVGVKNCYFMLEIYDYSLINVNPHAVDKEGRCTLTSDQIRRVIAECARNPWYYLREVVRIETPGVADGIPYKANRGNIAQAWCIINNLDSWLCLTRQQGKTISALALLAWVYNFGATNTEFLFLNKSGDDAKLNLGRIGNIIQLLPSYLRFQSIIEEDGKVTKAKQNATEYKHPVIGNSIKIKPQAASYEKAISIGRGLTSGIQHYDEPEFTPFIDVIVENAVSTFETAHRLALEQGCTSARIFTCTPGDLDTKSGQAAAKLLKKTFPWDDHMYDWTIEKILDAMKKQESNGILYIEFSYLQIGLTREWLEYMYDKIGNPLTVRREILLQRMRGSDLSPYDRDDIEYIISAAHKPIGSIFLQTYYQLHLYDDLDPRKLYVLGVDCASGIMGDSNAITVLDPYTTKPVAIFKCPYIGETDYLKLITELVVEHIPRSIVIIERNNVGDAIIDTVLNTPNHALRDKLYFDKSKDYMEEKVKEASTVESMLKSKAMLKTYYGLWTGKNRDDMFSILSNLVKNRKDYFVADLLIDDICNLVRTPGGKVAARKDEHDDVVMSYLIAMYVLQYGNNLPLFGYFPAEQLEERKRNSGLRHSDMTDLLPQEEIIALQKSERLEKLLNYEDQLRDALMREQSISQDNAYDGRTSNIYSQTNQAMLHETGGTSTFGKMDLNIFDELNNPSGSSSSYDPFNMFDDGGTYNF